MPRQPFSQVRSTTVKPIRPGLFIGVGGRLRRIIHIQEGLGSVFRALRIGTLDLDVAQSLVSIRKLLLRHPMILQQLLNPPLRPPLPFTPLSPSHTPPRQRPRKRFLRLRKPTFSLLKIIAIIRILNVLLLDFWQISGETKSRTLV